MINQAWLAEFTASFEQFVPGGDGEAIGRHIWAGYDDADRTARAAEPSLGYDDALAEADAWDLKNDDLV